MKKKGPKSLYQISKYDYVLGVVILLLSLGSIVRTMPVGHGEAGIVRIYRDNEMIQETTVSEDKIIHTGNLDIEISEGGVRVLKSDCPHQICVQTGRITRPTQTIVCVPNHILIEIEGVPGSAEYQAVSY